MEQKKSIGFGFRGWMLILYQFIAFGAFQVFTNYPMNIMASMDEQIYGNPTAISTIYTIACFVGIAIQLVMSGFIGKIKSIKALGVILGVATCVFGFGIMMIPASMLTLWLISYFMVTLCSTMYSTFALSILVGQWFPRRKGTVMGIATLSFPIFNFFISLFASNFYGSYYAGFGALAASGADDVTIGTSMPGLAQSAAFSAFLPFFIIMVAGLIIGIIFVKDYPEQCGAYRDNDRSFTPEQANAMLTAEIENKKTSVWKLNHTLTTRDFWFISVPMGLLLAFSVGVMTQSSSIIGQYEELDYTTIMAVIAACGCIGSYGFGLVDSKFGTKKAVLASSALMIVSGILGLIHSGTAMVISLIVLALFEGAASNYTVSAAAQYWRREDFSTVFSAINPIANIFQALGPMVIAMLLYSEFGVSGIFAAVGIGGVIAVILSAAFSSKHIKKKDDIYRKAAGKVLDDALVGRK